MPTNTERLDLFKYEVVQDANNTFNITKALNENWDKIDANVAKEQDIDGKWVFNRFELFSNKNLPQEYDQTFDLSNYLPNDGNNYEIILSFMGRTADAINSQFELGYSTDFITVFTYMIRTVTRTNSSISACGSSLGIVGPGRTVRIRQGAAAKGTSGECGCWVQAYRKVR